MVEIFKTNVNTKRQANGILKVLHAHLPACHFNFDLDDCDRILRVQTSNCPVEIQTIIQIVNHYSIEISLIQ